MSCRPRYTEDAFRQRVESWAADRFGGTPGSDSESAVRHLVRKMAEAGLLAFDFGRSEARRRASGIDLGAACIVREVLAQRSCFADQVFMDQAWGALAVSWFGCASLRAGVLPLVAQGKWLPAIVLPPLARRLSCRVENGEVIVGGMTEWVANAGIAKAFVVFATTPTRTGDGSTAVIIDRDTEGVMVLERVSATGTVPMARMRFKDCRVPLAQVLGRVEAASEVLHACQRLLEPSRDASRLGQARREIDRCARMQAAEDVERLRHCVREEAARIYRFARRLTLDRSPLSAPAALPSRACVLLQQARARTTSTYLRRES